MAETKRYPSILMFGCPGSGKGTQGVVLGQMPNLVHLAMGDIFRGLDKESDIGKEFLSYSTKGLLVPDELTVRVWTHHVEKMAASGTYRPDYHVLLLDGIPRTPSQVELLSKLIAVLRVIHPTRRSSRPIRAPSMRAASSSSIGISATALTRSIRVNGRLTTARIRPRPSLVSSRPEAAYIM